MADELTNVRNELEALKLRVAELERLVAQLQTNNPNQ